MKVAFYSLATGRCHQRSISDGDEKPRDCRDGEGMLVIDDKLFDQWLAQWKGGGDQDAIQEYVSEQTGLVPTDDRYVFILKGAIVDWVGQADPALGHFDEKLALWPDAVAVAHPLADETWTVTPAAPSSAKGVKMATTGSGWDFQPPPPTPEEQANMQAKGIPVEVQSGG